MLKVAQQLWDKSLLILLNAVLNAADAVANAVQYHLTCSVRTQRIASINIIEMQEMDDLNKVLAYIEIINICSIHNEQRKQFLDMNRVNTTCNKLLVNSTEEHMKKVSPGYFIMYLALPSFHLKEALKESGINCIDIKRKQHLSKVLQPKIYMIKLLSVNKLFIYITVIRRPGKIAEIQQLITELYGDV